MGSVMQAREMSDLFEKIRELLGIEGSFELADLTSKIEVAIATSELFDETTKKAFSASKKKGRYVIDPVETDLIKSVKALINLVTSIQSIDPKTFEKLKDYVSADEQGMLYGYFNLAIVGIAGLKDLKPIKQVFNDINEFSFYAKKVGELLPSFPALTSDANRKIQQLQDTFLHLPINQALGAVKVEEDERYKAKLSEPVPTINFDGVIEAVDSFGLKTNIDILIEMTEKNKSYTEIYVNCLEIKNAMQEARLLAERIGYDPRFHAPDLQWDDLSEDERSLYIKLNAHLKLILNGYNKLKTDCAESQLFSRAINRNGRWTTPQLTVLVQWRSSAASANIEGLSMSAEQAIQGVDVLIDQGISEQSRDYHNSATNLYVFPLDLAMDKTQRNLMLLHNISVHALTALRRFNAKPASFFSNITDKLGMLDDVGQLVSAFKALSPAELAVDSQQFIKNHVEAMLQQIVPVFHDSISVAQEAEIRLGLRAGVLLQRLEPLSKDIQALLKSLGCNIRVSIPPFNSERKLAIAKVNAEIEPKLKDMERVANLLQDKNPDLFKLLELIDRLKSIHTFNAQKYINYLQLIVDKMLGVDELERVIKDFEGKILQKVQQQHFNTSIALLTSTENEINAVLLDGETKEAIRKLRKLYVMRDQLQKMADTIKFTKLGLRVVPIRRFEQGRFVDPIHQVNAPDASDLKNCLLEDLAACMRKESDTAEALDALVPPAQEMEEVSDLFKSARGTFSLTTSVSASLATSLPFATARTRSVRRDTELFTTVPLATSSSVPPELTATQIVDATPIDDHEVVRSIINKTNGSIILQSEAARKNLIAYALRVLSDKEKDKLSQHMLNAIFLILPDDQALTVVVKTMYNTMLNFEHLMRLVNKLQKILGGSFLGYRKIPDLLGELKKALHVLLESLTSTNEALQVVRHHVEKSGLVFGELDLFNAFSAIAENLPSQVLSLASHMQSGLIDRLDADLAEPVKELAKQSRQLGKSANDLSLSTMISSPALSDVFAKFKPLVVALKAQLPQPNPDGTYDLTKFQDKSPQKCIAALVNASYKLLFVLNSAERYSNGSTISGLIDVLRGLYSAYQLINESNAFNFAKEVKGALLQNYNDLKALLEDQAKTCLAKFIPFVTRVTHQAASCEQVLGLKENIILENVNPYIEQLISLGKSFGVEEKATETDVFQTASVLQTSLLSSTRKPLSPIAEKRKRLNDWKVQQLLIACADYKHHLAEALSSELEKAHPGKYFSIDLNAPFNSLPSLVKDHSVLKLTIKKYNAVQALQSTLRSSKTSDQKIALFNSNRNRFLKSHTNLFGENRDSALIYFLKWVATILTVGIAASFGIWRTYGDNVSDQMKETVQRSELPRLA